MDPDTLFQHLQQLTPDQRCRFFARLRASADLWRELQDQPSPGIPGDVHYLLVFDGGSLGNPGKGYGSYALTRCDTGQQRIERLDFPETMTNNEAEYCTLIGALQDLLRKIREHGSEPQRFRIEIRGDSKLVINQVSDTWKARQPRMQQLCSEAKSLLAEFGGYRLVHHGREHSVAVLGH